MKKLSVLLVIGLFCIPMLVYGFTQTGFPSVISRSISSIVKIGFGSLQKASSVLQGDDAMADSLTPNPFFKEPWGAKGIITAIDTIGKTITLKDAVYYDSALDQLLKSDIIVYVNEYTHYNRDLIEPSQLEELQVGNLVICSGPPIHYTEKTMQYASDVYVGKFIADDAVCMKNFLGPIHELNVGAKTFAIDYFAEDGMVYTIHATITPDTQVLIARKTSSNNLIGPEMGIIPDFAKDYDSVSGTFIIKQDLTAEVQLITFYEN